MHPSLVNNVHRLVAQKKSLTMRFLSCTNTLGADTTAIEVPFVDSRRSSVARVVAVSSLY